MLRMMRLVSAALSINSLPVRSSRSSFRCKSFSEYCDVFSITASLYIRQTGIAVPVFKSSTTTLTYFLIRIFLKTRIIFFAIFLNPRAKTAFYERQVF